MKIGDYVRYIDESNGYFENGKKYLVIYSDSISKMFSIMDNNNIRRNFFSDSSYFFTKTNEGSNEGIKEEKEIKSEYAIQSHGRQAIDCLTKIEHFAGLAMQGLLSYGMTSLTVEELVSHTYVIAKEMVEQGKNKSLKVIKVSDGINVKYVVERSFLGTMIDYLHYEDNYTTNLDEAQKCDTIGDALCLISLMRGCTKYKKIK